MRDAQVDSNGFVALLIRRAATFVNGGRCASSSSSRGPSDWRNVLRDSRLPGVNEPKKGSLRLVHFGDQSRRFSFDGVQAMSLTRDASAGIALPSLMARDVTPLAMACGVLVPGALQRARRAGPHVPLPGTRGCILRWPVMAYYRPRGFLVPAARARPGAPRTPPGRCRALHINASAMC